MTHSVFISYATDDAPSATSIRDGLEAVGLLCWMAPRDIAPGADYAEQIIDAIEACAVMVLVLSETSNRSQYVRNEVERAIAKRKTVIPVRIHNVQPSRALEFFVSNAQWIDAWQGPLETAIAALAVAIGKHAVERARHALAAPSAVPATAGDLMPRPARKGNLPSQLTSFIGRVGEIEEIAAEVRANRLVTLMGMGGIGKTRLAIQVAEKIAEYFDQGVWFVELAALSNTDLIPLTMLSVMGITEQPGMAPLESLKEYLRDKKLLIVLDSCEHVIDAAAKVANAILNAAPAVKFLATSRESLGVTGERTQPISSLALPDLKGPPSLEQHAQSEAVRLFVERAMLAAPHFRLDALNGKLIVDICQRLDGIPLAIELAAARVKMMSAEQILGRLDDKFRLLTGGARTALPRQQTLRASIDWSFGLLTETERLLLRRLSVFSGGFALDAAEGVCAGDGILPFEVLDILTQLVNKSLVVVIGHAQNEETRYRMLETIRQYASESLAASGASADARTRHLQFFLGLAERAEVELTGPRQVAWLDRLEADLANLRSALGWALETNVDGGLRMVSALMNFWGAHSHHRDASERLTELLSRPQGLTEPLVRAKALSVQAFLLLERGDVFGRARLSAEEGLAMFRTLGDKHGIAFSLEILGTVLCWANYDSEAQRLFRECLAISRELGDKYLAAIALANLGFWGPPSDYSGKREYYEESLALHRELGHAAGIGVLLRLLGQLALDMGNFALGQSLLEESLSPHTAHGSHLMLVWTYVLLGDAAFYMGDLERAREHYKHYLVVSEETGRLAQTRMAILKLGQVALHQGDPKQARAHLERAWPFYGRSHSTFLNFEIIYFLEALANLAVAEKRFTSGARLFAWVAAFRRSKGSPLRQTDRKMATLGGMASIHAQLDEATLAAATAAGEALTFEEAVALGLAVGP